MASAINILVITSQDELDSSAAIQNLNNIIQWFISYPFCMLKIDCQGVLAHCSQPGTQDLFQHRLPQLS